MADALLAKTSRCVACGLCLPHCPTYRKTQSEADAPRGRILLTQAVVQGVLPMNEKYMAHIDLCLSCRACENVCPNQVSYGDIIDEARARMRQSYPPSLLQRAARYLVANRVWWRSVGLALHLANRLGLHRRFRSVPATTPPLRFKTFYEAQNATGEVALFLGCVTSMLDAQTLAATIYLLNRLGYNVHVPTRQTCCGGLHRQMGDKKGAQALEERNLEAFGSLTVLAVASGCGARLAEYMPDRVHDISAFLARCDWDGIHIAPLYATIAVHDPCSSRNVLKAEQFSYAMLQRIPGVKTVPLPENDLCCGGAGSYMLTHPEMANQLCQDKINAYQTIQSEYLATSNIGCALHLARGLGDDVRVVHPVWIVARQMGFTGVLP